MAKARSSTTVRSFNSSSRYFGSRFLCACFPGSRGSRFLSSRYSGLRRLAFALALMALPALLPTLAFARTDAEIREVVKALIMNRHPQDTPAHWLNLGPRAPAILQSMYETENSTYHRMRLLEGLGAFTEDAAAKEFIKKQAEEASSEVVRHAALRSIGQNQAAQEEEWLGGFLKHDNPHTRLLAAELLRKVETESAKAKVSSMMRDEKTAWVLSALKGEAPAAGTLTPTGSSEDRLSSEFAGTWRGFWVEAQTGVGKSGMKSEPAVFKIAVEPGNRLSGTLQIRSRPAGRSYSLKDVSGKSLRWSGKLLLGESVQPAAAAASASPTPQSVARPEPVAIEAELARRAGNLLLEIRAPQTGILLVLRRD